MDARCFFGSSLLCRDLGDQRVDFPRISKEGILRVGAVAVPLQATVWYVVFNAYVGFVVFTFQEPL